MFRPAHWLGGPDGPLRSGIYLEIVLSGPFGTSRKSRQYGITMVVFPKTKIFHLQYAAAEFEPAGEKAAN